MNDVFLERINFWERSKMKTNIERSLEESESVNINQLGLNHVQSLIIKECDSVKELLLKKNREYGNSAIDPKRIFSSASPVEQIKVRIDDKLSRISSKAEKEIKEDTIQDLLGYLILLKVAQELYGKD